MGRQSSRASRLPYTPAGDPLGEKEPLLAQNVHLLWMKPGGCSCFWPQHRFKVIKLRGRGIVYTLGFQKLRKRAFSLSLKDQQKEYVKSNETLDGEQSIRRETPAGELLELMARAILPPKPRWDS